MNLTRLASDIADRVIHAQCEHAARRELTRALADAVLGKRRRPRRPNWRARDRFLAPYEEKLRGALAGVWERERRIVLSNMRKYPLKGMAGGAGIVAHKENPVIDNWLYPSSPFMRELSAKTQKVLSELLKMSIPKEIENLGLDLHFEVVNEHAVHWLNEYTIKLSGNLEEINVSDLKNTLLEGIDAGENMADLKRRVNELFEEYNDYRAETIARSETIRTSNEGIIAVGEVAGFDKLIWLANPGCCDLCAELDGKIIDINGTFFDDDYGDGRSLRHPRCRCSVSIWDESWGD